MKCGTRVPRSDTASDRSNVRTVDSGRRVERPRRATPQDDRVEVVDHRKVAFERRRGRPRLAESLVVAGVLGERHERELDGRHVDRAGCCLAAGADRRRAATQADDGEREFLRPVGTDQPCDGRVGKAGQQSGPITARFGERERVREHRAGVPVDVPEPTLGVPPSRPPRDPGNDDGRRLPDRRRRDEPERMTDRVVPVDAIAQPGDAARGHVELEGKESAGRPRRAEQEPPAVPTHGDAHDPGRQVEETGESVQVEGRRDCPVASGQEVDRRGAARAPTPLAALPSGRPSG